MLPPSSNAAIRKYRGSQDVFCGFGRLVQPTAVSHGAFVVSAMRMAGSRGNALPFNNRVGRGVRRGRVMAHCACVPIKRAYVRLCVCVCVTCRSLNKKWQSLARGKGEAGSERVLMLSIGVEGGSSSSQSLTVCAAAGHGAHVLMRARALVFN